MACIKSCMYCGGQLSNADWHKECRLIETEDILSIIEKELELGKIRGVSMPVLVRIIDQEWTTKKEAEKRTVYQQQKASKKRWWELEKEEFLNNALKQWEAENPDPDPLMIS